MVVVLLVAACSSPHPVKGTATPGPSSSTTPPPTATPAGTQPPTPSPTGAPAAVGPVGTAVPRGFDPTSATFVSPLTGWVLGQAPCSAGRCDAVVRTRDGGRTWRAVPAPSTSPDRLVGIRFADVRNGYVYGEGLWVTHDGGATWTQVKAFAQVGPLESAKGRVWFVSQGKGLFSGSTTGAPYALETTDTDGSLVVHGTTVLTATRPGKGSARLSVGTHGGGFVQRATPCTAEGRPVVGARTTTDLLLVCSGGAGAGREEKTAYTTEDGGLHWKRVGDPPPVPGTRIFLTPRSAFIVDNRGVEVSRDGGRTWDRSLVADGLGEGGLESAALGYAIGDFGQGNVTMLTHDDGRSWARAAF
jgi:photosystem II stability/assembly factor-like uncharacterized protein